MREKILHLQQQLNQGLVGRGEALRAALLALVAGENALLIGPPGTAKSLLARRLSEVIAPEGDQPAYFEYLLTKFSTPEELFGPLSLSALKQDRFQRNTQGYLPTVQVAFLDEIFKASSSILNSLLTILNERKFHNGTEAMQVPLQSLVAASNELPRGQPELAALYDRFLIRRHVDYLEPEQLAELFAPQPAATVDRQNQLTVTELAALREQAAAVVFPAEIQQAVREIWREHGELFREHAEERLSDRRFVKVVHLLRIAAASNGRKEVDLSDLVLLKDCLWSDEANAPRVHELVMTVVKKYDRVVPLKGEGKKPLKVQAVQATPKPAGQVIKGLKGSGTATDPFLIENLNHLLRLAQPEVGQQGYYFRQTADIDASEISSLMAICFSGLYDGAGFCIAYNNPDYCIFGRVWNSVLIGLNLRKLGLAKQVSNSKIGHCKTDANLLDEADGCDVFYCQAKKSIARCISDCKIIFCASERSLISFCGRNSSVSDCAVNFIQLWNEKIKFGLVETGENLRVERCFVGSEKAHYVQL